MTTATPRTTHHTLPSRAVATAPGSIGNVGPGLDVLGCALTGLRDGVTATWGSRDGVQVLDAGHPDLPRDPMRHTAALAAAAVLRMARAFGVTIPHDGLELTARKALPLSGGQGGSAASAVAGAVATNALLGDPLDTTALLACCLSAEEVVAGRHLDNIAPALLGGIVLVQRLDPIKIVRLPVPHGLRIVLAHPAQRLSTKKSRSVLPDHVPRGIVTHQLAQVAAMVAACYTDDLELFGHAIDDRIAEPARAPLLPAFEAAKRAALSAGALGASISGAGPTAFAVVADETIGTAVASAMRAAYGQAGFECDTRITEIDLLGADVEAASR